MGTKKPKFKGSMVALVTPFRNDRIDEKALHRLIDFQLKAGTDVLIPCGTTGESATMSHEEHRYVMSLVIEHVDGRVPVICGAGSNNTEEAAGLVQYAKTIKADGVLVVTPYYNRPTQAGLYRHYEFLASRAGMPMVLYNVPGRTGISMAPDTVAKLYKLPEVVAIKEASGRLDQVDEILQRCDITVLSGDDGLTFPMIAVGAKGCISVTANVAPRKMRDMVHSALAGKMEKARRLHQELVPLSNAMFLETNPIPVKTALGKMKMIHPHLRLPLCAMSKDKEKKLVSALKKAKVLK